MNLKEAELVIISDETYNLCPGGNGGFGYINQSILTKDMRIKNGKKGGNNCKDRSFSQSLEFKKFKSNELKTKWSNGKYKFIPSTKDLKFSDKTKEKMSKSSSGSLNSQFGSMWITNGTENKKIKSIDSIPEGWYKGRKTK